jgi:uncharacterized protein (TIGR04255 family)
MTSNRPVDLPEFTDPPVVETLLSIQFDRLSLPKTAHFGLYWNTIRERFPQTQEQSELPAVFERQAEQPQAQVGIQVQPLEVPLTPRFWFLNNEGTELIQVQRDRFIKNWRKVGEDEQYPRYERVRAGFDKDFEEFKVFIERQELGTVRVNQCEVTYINHIVSGEGWETHGDFKNVFTMWLQPESAFPGRAQDVALRARFPMSDREGNFCGRLHVAVQPVWRISDGRAMFLMELTARGQARSEMDFFDLGRVWIVKSFAELTTPEMHKIWGRKH